MLKDLEKQAKVELHSQCSQKPLALRNKRKEWECGCWIPSSNKEALHHLVFSVLNVKCPQQLLPVASCGSPTSPASTSYAKGNGFALIILIWEWQLFPVKILDQHTFLYTSLLPCFSVQPSTSLQASTPVSAHASLRHFQALTLSVAAYHVWAILYWKKWLQCLERSKPSRVLTKSSRRRLATGC